MKNNYLYDYMKQGKRLYLVSDNGNKATQRSVYYIQDNELIRVFRSDFFSEEELDVLRTQDTEKMIKTMKKSGKLPAYSKFCINDFNKPFFYFGCSVIGASRPLEIILSIGRHLGLEFSEIHQNYKVL